MKKSELKKIIRKHINEQKDSGGPGLNETRSLLNEVEDCGCGHRIMCDDSDQAQFYCSPTCCGETIYCDDGAGPYSHDPSEDGSCRTVVSPDAEPDFDQSFYDSYGGEYGPFPGQEINLNKDVDLQKKIISTQKKHCPSRIGEPLCKRNLTEKPLRWWAFMNPTAFAYWACCWEPNYPDPPA